MSDVVASNWRLVVGYKNAWRRAALVLAASGSVLVSGCRTYGVLVLPETRCLSEAEIVMLIDQVSPLLLYRIEALDQLCEAVAATQDSRSL